MPVLIRMLFLRDPFWRYTTKINNQAPALSSCFDVGSGSNQFYRLIPISMSLVLRVVSFAIQPGGEGIRPCNSRQSAPLQIFLSCQSMSSFGRLLTIFIVSRLTAMTRCSSSSGCRVPRGAGSDAPRPSGTAARRSRSPARTAPSPTPCRSAPERAAGGIAHA